MPLALVHVRTGRRVPAEMIVLRAALVAVEHHRRVDEGVVVHARIRAVEHADALPVVDEHVPRGDEAPGNFEEKADLGAFDMVVHEHAIDIADVTTRRSNAGADHQVVAHHRVATG